MPAKALACPKCGSDNIQVQMVNNVQTKHRGCLGWCGWIFLAIITLGLVLIIPLLTNKKVQSENQKHAICQNCGNSWILKK